MPATRQALSVTEAYRTRLATLTAATQRKAKGAWRGVSFRDLRGTYGPIRVGLERDVRAAQREAVLLTRGYVGAFLSAELKQQVAAPHLLPVVYVGKSFGGLPLYESLQKPLTVTLVAIRDGKPDPMGLGRNALLVNVDLDVKHAARAALMDAIKADDRITGWQRAIRGTCGACAGAATGHAHGIRFPVHPGCQCVSEPIVDTPEGDLHPRPTGQQHFDALTRAQQDEMVGPVAAEKVRTGAITLADLLLLTEPGDTPGFIVQKPDQDL